VAAAVGVQHWNIPRTHSSSWGADVIRSNGLIVQAAAVEIYHNMENRTDMAMTCAEIQVRAAAADQEVGCAAPMLFKVHMCMGVIMVEVSHEPFYKL
jgi:hypothetical protein